jgi:HNH endonuclease
VNSGYIAESVRQRVREQAKNRCGYCQSSQQYILGVLEIEHIIPTAKSGASVEENLWLSCRLCNGHKGVQTHAPDPVTQTVVALFNPRVQVWSEHFTWNDDGTIIIGRTPCGRATVIALKLNNEIAVSVRSNWVRAGWHPPKDEE